LCALDEWPRRTVLIPEGGWQSRVATPPRGVLSGLPGCWSRLLTSQGLASDTLLESLPLPRASRRTLAHHEESAFRKPHGSFRFFSSSSLRLRHRPYRRIGRPGVGIWITAGHGRH